MIRWAECPPPAVVHGLQVELGVRGRGRTQESKGSGARAVLALGLAAGLLGGCTTQTEVVAYPDLRVDPEPTPAVLTDFERDEAIADLKAAGAKNAGH